MIKLFEGRKGIVWDHCFAIRLQVMRKGSWTKARLGNGVFGEAGKDVVVEGKIWIAAHVHFLHFFELAILDAESF